MWKTTSSRHFLCTIVQENDPKKSLKILFKTHCRYSGLFLSCILWDSFGIRQYTYIYTNVLVHLFWLTLSLWTITFVLQLHFNYTSTIHQLYINYTSTMLQLYFNYIWTILEQHWRAIQQWFGRNDVFGSDSAGTAGQYGESSLADALLQRQHQSCEIYAEFARLWICR